MGLCYHIYIVTLVPRLMFARAVVKVLRNLLLRLMLLQFKIVHLPLAPVSTLEIQIALLAKRTMIRALAGLM